MPPLSAKPVLFLAFANDRLQRAGYLRNLGHEADQLRTVLQPAHAICEVIERHSITPDQILQVFQQQKDRIALFHYAGHADEYRLLLEDQRGGQVMADGRGLAAFLQQQRGLSLVFLNACSTRAQVQSLLAAGVAVVIATSRKIDDKVATDFATNFYRALASGDTLQAAFDSAQAAMQLSHGEQLRHLTAITESEDDHQQQNWPWQLYTADSDKAGLAWSLRQAAHDPFFGLPPLPKLDLPAKPFRDLSWFRRADTPIFFGRGWQIRELYTILTDPNSAPILLFYGQSGVGKSSLLEGGLLPRLEQVQGVVYMRRDPEQGLLGTLLQNLPKGSHSADKLLTDWCNHEQATQQPLTLLIDQVEEYFTRTNQPIANEMADFVDALVALFAKPEGRPQGKLILSFRKEWLAEIEKRLMERDLPTTKLFLERLDKPGVIEAITGVSRTPALQQKYKLTIEEGLPEEITNELLTDRDAPIAPMLQILLTRLWEEAGKRSQSSPRFDRPLYDQLRRDGLKLDQFLDRQLTELDKQHPDVVVSGLALDLLAFHTTPLGTAEQRDWATLHKEYQHRQEILADVVRGFQNLYLLVDPAADQADAIPKSRLAHDTLAPLVRAKFDESDRPGQRARRILEARAVDWEEGKIGTTLDQTDLTFVESGRSGMRMWTESENRLLDASRAEQKRRMDEQFEISHQQEVARQRQLELAQQIALSESARAESQSLAAKRLRWVLITLSGLSIVMLAWIGVLVLPLIQEWRAIRLARGNIVTIPAGKAVIGTNLVEGEPAEKPEINFNMPTLKIEKYEVSNYQYRLCIQHRACSETRNSSEIYDDTYVTYPVRYLTVIQAAAYCSWIGRRLPTEIEWEYAARGETGRIWPWGNTPRTGEKKCAEKTGFCPVTAFEAAKTPEGVYNLDGNVWEWTSSYFQKDYEGYDTSLIWNGKVGTLVADPVFVLRGGSTYNRLTQNILYRHSSVAHESSPDYGVRCVEE